MRTPDQGNAPGSHSPSLLESSPPPSPLLGDVAPSTRFAVSSQPPNKPTTLAMDPFPPKLLPQFARLRLNDVSTDSKVRWAQGGGG
jgi:hypothetical protein